MSTTTLFPRLAFAELLCAMFCLFGTSARAQLDPQALAQLAVLETRFNLEIQTLQTRANRAEAATASLQAETRLLSQELATLKARPPTEAGKAPAKGQVLSLRAPFTVKDDSGRVIFKVDATSGNLPRAIVGNPAGARVEIGIGLGGASVVGLYDESSKLLSTLVGNPKGSYLQVRDNEQSVSLGKVEGDGVGLHLRKGEKIILKVDTTSANLPRAIVGNPVGARAEIGIGVGGASVVGLYDESNKLLSTLVGDPKGSYLRVKDNEQSTNLGKVEGDGAGLFMRKDDKLFGEVSVGKNGHGIAKVFGSDGKAVGALLANAEGGGLALTGPGGGKSAVSLGVTPSGGKVRVYPAAGGSTRAELVADGDLGALNVYSSDGTNAVTVTSVASKGGKMEMTNASG